MAETLNVEQRLAALEKEVADLKQRLEQVIEPKKNWIDQITGSMADIPEEVFRKYLECCAEAKKQVRDPYDDQERSGPAPWTCESPPSPSSET